MFLIGTWEEIYNNFHESKINMTRWWVFRELLKINRDSCAQGKDATQIIRNVILKSNQGLRDYLTYRKIQINTYVKSFSDRTTMLFNIVFTITKIKIDSYL